MLLTVILGVILGGGLSAQCQGENRCFIAAVRSPGPVQRHTEHGLLYALFRYVSLRCVLVALTANYDMKQLRSQPYSASPFKLKRHTTRHRRYPRENHERLPVDRRWKSAQHLDYSILYDQVLVVQVRLHRITFYFMQHEVRKSKIASSWSACGGTCYCCRCYAGTCY